MDYAAKFGKAYKNWDEFEVRKALYSKNKEFSDLSNANPANNYKSGDNQFSDLSEKEF